MEKEKYVKLEDVMDILNRKIAKYDYRNFLILDELYDIQDQVQNLDTEEKD